VYPGRKRGTINLYIEVLFALTVTPLQKMTLSHLLLNRESKDFVYACKLYISNISITLFKSVWGGKELL